MSKPLYFVISLIFSTTLLYGQQKVPYGILDKEVPRRVTNAFKQKAPNAENAKWYPYPYQYRKDQSTTPLFFPAGWSGAGPDYYEVRFEEKSGKTRMVFDRGGAWIVTSRILTIEDLPAEIINQLSEKGYADWKTVNIERITRNGETGRFYKVWLKQESKKRILYFNESNKIVKTLKWDNDVSFAANSNARFKDAPGYTRQKKLAGEEVPEKVKDELGKEYKDIVVSAWYVNERVYDPFETGLPNSSYYDISIPVFYQVLFTYKKVRYIATYTAVGEILEIAEVIKMKNLPPKIQQVLKGQYSAWKLEKEHDKVELDDGLFLYKVYGKESNVMKMMIFDGAGTRVDL